MKIDEVEKYVGKNVRVYHAKNIILEGYAEITDVDTETDKDILFLIGKKTEYLHMLFIEKIEKIELLD